MTHEISCKELVDMVSGYLEETLSDGERAQFEQHLVECGYCNAYVEQMHLTIKLTHKLAETDTSKPAPDDLLSIFRKWKEEQKPD